MTTGLWVFLVVQAINIIALVIDYGLDQAGLATITAIVVKYPLIGVLIIAWQITGTIGLACHFYVRCFCEGK